MNDHLQDFEEVTTRRLTDVEDLVAEVKDSVQDKFDQTINEIDDIEVRLLDRIDGLDRRFDELEKNTDQRFDNVEARVDVVNYKLRNFQAFSLNGIADRFITKVAPIGIDYLDSQGHTCYKYPPGPPRSISYYWKMHQPKHHDKLKALHEFYLIPYIAWAIDEDSSEEDDCLDPPDHPSSLEAAIAKYPSQAIRVLFTKLRLIYSKFEEQARRIQSLDQGKATEKRASSRALPLGTPKSKVRR
jgi:hypothetical protein